MAYEALILLPSDSDVSIEEVHRTLENYFAGDAREIAFSVAGNRLTIAFGDWNCYVALNSAPSVLEESKDLAAIFAKDRPDREAIAASGIRLEVAADDDDEMEYFNDYLMTVEKLGQYRGAKIWEGAQEEFIN